MDKADEELIKKLFQEASKYPLDYMFALLRVAGIESYDEDPLQKLSNKIATGNSSIEDVRSSKELWTLISNISRVGRQLHYMPFPPLSPKNDSYKEVTLELHVLGKLRERLKEISDESEIDLIGSFLTYFRVALEDFKDASHEIFPIDVERGAFEVFEILADNNGLNGFKVYFSNDSTAVFKRTSTGTEGFNVIPDSGIGFMVGNRDELKPAWRMEGKWLYEVGLPGRYNEPQEWKPMVYKGKSDLIQSEAEKMSDDERVQDVFFYMLATGYPVIEFAARTSIKLPEPETILEDNIRMLRVNPENDLKNQFVYDGWLRLEDRSPEGVRLGVESIQRAMEGLGFAFDKEVRWRLKYGMRSHRPGAAQPSQKDMQFLNKLLENSNKEKDLVIDAAINWYNLGTTTQNPLNAFLCFHIAIEGLAAKLAQGKLNASSFYSLKKETKTARKKRIKDSFEKYYGAYYATDLEELIKQSYFEGIVPIKHCLQTALRAVFGEENPVLDDYFQKGEGIWDVRGKLVHEVYSEWHPEEYAKIQRKLYNLQQIAKAFITRVALRVPAGEKRPTWSGMYAMATNMDNPTSTMVVSHLGLMSGNDWRIKGEWID